ncbi:MAG: UDP-galactopyranose mutase [Lachnospiraceae bacterium]|nr:UDP-galactopyranose mutase [Lachnospiraceae bacterium]
MFDFLVVGAGLSGAVFAHEAHKAGRSVLVIDRRLHIGGNIYTENVSGIEVHRYGAHIFHTDDPAIWQYMQQFARFNDYVNRPEALYRGERYSLPFNMYTFEKMWGVTDPAAAQAIIEEQRAAYAASMRQRQSVNDTTATPNTTRLNGAVATSAPGGQSATTAKTHIAAPSSASDINNPVTAAGDLSGGTPNTFMPQNLEEQAISLVGRDIFEKLVKGYTEKQWGRDCRDLPAFIIRRLPVRFTYDNNYFNDPYQGIPEDGYTAMIARMLTGIEVRLGVDYLAHRAEMRALAREVIYTGPIDAYFDACYGPLTYRTLRFEDDHYDEPDHQGNAVINHTDWAVPYTRTIEHKWFTFGKDAAGNPIADTIVTREYPAAWENGCEPYYPVNDDANNALYARYRALAENESRVHFAGRLGTYAYLDMDDAVARALDLATRLLTTGEAGAER